MATGFAGSCGHSVIEQLDKSARGDEGLPLSLGDYPASNLVGVALLTVGSQDPGQLGSRIGIEDLGRGQILASHPHVERRILSVGKPAFWIVNLERGDAEVKQNPLHLGAAQPGQHRRQLVVDRLDERDPVSKLSQPLAAIASACGSRSSPISWASGHAASSAWA